MKARCFSMRSVDLQAKLLRVLQEGNVERIGDEQTRRVDVRVIAATNLPLRTETEAGRFRQDLFYRLSVFPIELPPLRRRVEDIPLLAEHFLNRIARQLGRPCPRLTIANVQELQLYNWPGNIRKLQHTLERACIVANDGKLRFDLPDTGHRQAQRPATFSVPDAIPTELNIRSLGRKTFVSHWPEPKARFMALAEQLKSWELSPQR